MPDLLHAVDYLVVFLFSTTLHEAAHAWAAARGGDLTAYHGGQVSLNPLPHMKREPIGLVILPIFSTFTMGWPLGYASAPYDRAWAARYPKRAAWMALAGPATNLLLVIIAALLVRLGASTGVLYAPETVRFGDIAATNAGGLWPMAAQLLGALFSMNLLLFAFNLLPLPPLDGSTVLPLFLSPEATRRYQELIWRTPELALLGFFVAWKFFDVIFNPIFFASLSVLYPGVSYH